MLATEITNHVQQAIARLLQQYQNLPYMTGVITALVDQIQDLEDGLYPLNAGRQIYEGNAVGKQLDELGTLIGLQRNGLADNEYLVLLLGTIAEDNSDTTIPVLANIVLTLFEAANVFYKTPNSPGVMPGDLNLPAWIAFGVGGAQIDPSLYPVIEQILQNSIGAGISLLYISTYDALHGFAMAGPAPGGGFSDLYDPQPTDGLWASLIFNNPAQ